MQRSIEYFIQELKDDIIEYQNKSSEAFKNKDYDKFNYYGGVSTYCEITIRRLEAILEVYGECNV